VGQSDCGARNLTVGSGSDEESFPPVAYRVAIHKDSSPFWELPQPKPQEILTALQNQTPVDMSGVTTVEKTITQDGRNVKLYIMTPQNVNAKPGVLFLHSRHVVNGIEEHGNMAAALALMARDQNGPKIALQVLFIPATDASVDSWRADTPTF